ncbi:MAG: hypothetical protein ACM3UV_07975 [Nocardioidaceae bacterium]
MASGDSRDAQPPADPRGANRRTAVMFAIYLVVIVVGHALVTTIGALGR